MPAELIQHKDNTLTVQFGVTLTGHMLEDEQSLQNAVNDAGCIAMAPMIKQFDTNGEGGGLGHHVSVLPHAIMNAHWADALAGDRGAALLGRSDIFHMPL